MRTIFTIAMLFTLCLGASAQNHKLSPYVRELMLQESQQRAVRQAPGQNSYEPRLCAFIKATDEGILRDNGCQILASWGDIYAANIPMSRLNQLASCHEIQRIEAGRPSEVMLDTAVIMSRADQVWRYNELYAQTPTDDTQGYTGKGVVMGVMDIGFDLTHPTFFSSDMQDYRIRALWDQLDRTSGGRPVEGKDTTYLGRQYTDMEALLAKGCSYDGRIAQHGSHTAAIAAGSGAPLFMNEGSHLFRGVAHDADICLVANRTTSNNDSVPEEMRPLYTTATNALGFKYIFDYAEAHNQPCVISFSEGHLPDFYGEDLLYSQVLLSMLGPGRILVASAGNQSYYNTYFAKPQGTNRAGAFVLPQKDYAFYTFRSSKEMDLELTFYPQGSEPVTRLLSTGDIAQCQDSVYQDTLQIGGHDYALIAAVYPSCYNEEELATEFYIGTTDKSTIGGDTPISIAITGRDYFAEAYSLGGYFTTNTLDATLCQMEASHNINNPAAFNGIIGVGSINSRRGIRNREGEYYTIDNGALGRLSSFSSVGPTMAGDIKPDVTAVGSSVYSAGSSFYNHAQRGEAWTIIQDFEANGRQYQWVTNCGTSMATPIVAGVVALWLQACPTLTPHEVLQTLAATCTHPDETLTYPNCQYGHGSIDAVAGLQYIQRNFSEKTDGVHHETDMESQRDKDYYDLMGRKITYGATRPHGIYICNGKKFVR